MRMTIAFRVLGALLLIGAAALARNQAQRSRHEAGAWQQLATLRYDAVPAADLPAWPALASGMGDVVDAGRREATVAYWLGRYDDLVGPGSGSSDPEMLVVAANAALRLARRERAVGPEAARQLDGVIQAYTRVLEAAPRHADAAYNLEFVVRLRDELAEMKPPPQPKDRSQPRAAGPIQTTDIPRGPTVHGLPGGPPPATKGEEFEILTPRDFGERETEPGQAKGGTMRRKG